MKKLLLVSTLCLTTMVGFAADLQKPSVFQLRLVSEKPSSLTEEVVLSRNNSEQKLQVQKDCLLDSSAIKSAKVVSSNIVIGENVSGDMGALSTNVTTQINIEFTDVGAKKMEEFTAQHIGQRLAVFIDGKIWAAPTIADQTRTSFVQISGSFSKQDAEAMVEKIKASIPK